MIAPQHKWRALQNACKTGGAGIFDLENVCSANYTKFVNRGGVECRHAARNAREPGGNVGEGHPKAEIRRAAATTSRCVGSEKVASRSGDRPAISLWLMIRFWSQATKAAVLPGP